VAQKKRAIKPPSHPEIGDKSVVVFDAKGETIKERFFRDSEVEELKNFYRGQKNAAIYVYRGWEFVDSKMEKWNKRVEKKK
jgi:hypothetical protein